MDVDTAVEDGGEDADGDEEAEGDGNYEIYGGGVWLYWKLGGVSTD